MRGGRGNFWTLSFGFAAMFRLYNLKNTERQELAVSLFEIEPFKLTMYDIIDFVAAALVPQE
jgi:hypothetical protein